MTINNWIDYGLFWLYIYTHERFNLAYLMPIPMFSLFSWFLYCNTCSRNTKNMKPNAKIKYGMGKDSFFFVWDKLLFYREVICFLINNLFGNDFQTSKVIGLIMLLSNCMWNSSAKKVFKLLEKVFSSYLKVFSFPRHFHILAYLV